MSVVRIHDIKIPLEVVLGTAEGSVEDIAAITEGTILELDTLAGEPVELRAGGSTIAYGEVVVIDEYFGIRITKINPTKGEQGNG